MRKEFVVAFIAMGLVCLVAWLWLSSGEKSPEAEMPDLSEESAREPSRHVPIRKLAAPQKPDAPRQAAAPRIDNPEEKRILTKNIRGSDPVVVAQFRWGKAADDLGILPPRSEELPVGPTGIAAYGDRILYVADDVKQRLVAVDLREGGKKVLLSGRRMSSIAVDRSGLLYVMDGKSGDIVLVKPTGRIAGTVPLRSILGEGEEAEKLVQRAGEVWVKLVGGKIARPGTWIFEKGNPPAIKKRDDRIRTRFLRGGAMQIAVARDTDGKNQGDWRDVVIEGKPRDTAMEYLGVDGTGNHYLLIECLGEDGEVEAYVRKLDATGELLSAVRVKTSQFVPTANRFDVSGGGRLYQMVTEEDGLFVFQWELNR
jgi:hypothetical protein